ncbi:hypothetical protein CEUSTIGMA_g12592.t1 [Chlamydomonas eustigma]|uniref:Anaphase-promoting complex subunit 4 WD40 domain-containing protein n=1 Tax=Chlamydomonas eustigma TaxID=1157962 RepID=A0A250XQ15_9CHLO|nr:hypothetical protein CEUSTIGMA_g12592.t1 [Chlamydomonas eustigma]|eukprot:GAX85174.1 hypothetical protein CEUSTIGMA_g12592.t1 [Chlamydomonas eustigma]
MSTVTQSSPPALSFTSQCILYVSGSCFLLFLVIVLVVISRLLGRIVRLATKSSASKAVAKKISKKVESDGEESSQVQEVAKHQPSSSANLKTLIKEAQKASHAKKGLSKDDHASHHPLFINTLKGHGDVVHGVTWSSDSKLLATSCDDMMVRIFDLSDITNREPKFRRIKTPRIPVGAGFSDSKGEQVAVVMRGIPDTIVAMFSPTATKTLEGGTVEQLWQVSNVHGKEPVLQAKASCSSSGRANVIVSLSTKKDAKVFNMQGKEMAALEPNSLGNHELALSGDGRFIAVASFTSEVKIWEVKTAKDTGAVTGVVKAMDLKGHKKKVMSVALSPDGKRAVTVSQDGTLRVWNIDVRYSFSEDPKTLLTIAIPLAGGRCYQHLAYGPTGIIAASYDGMVYFIHSSTGELLDSIDAHDGYITELSWSPKLIKMTGREEPVAVLATSGTDKRVRMWRCP